MGSQHCADAWQGVTLLLVLSGRTEFFTCVGNVRRGVREWCALLVSFALPERRVAHVACWALSFVLGSVIDKAQSRFLTLFENPLFLQRITLTCGRGARVSIEEGVLPRASAVHNNK
jgi:hypothetical protein